MRDCSVFTARCGGVALKFCNCFLENVCKQKITGLVIILHLQLDSSFLVIYSFQVSI